eukprot:2423257-Pyramimonas_sp.AAC.1
MPANASVAHQRKVGRQVSIGVQRDHQRGASRDLTNRVAACAPEGLLLRKMCFAEGASIHSVRGPTRVIGGRVAVQD